MKLFWTIVAAVLVAAAIIAGISKGSTAVENHQKTEKIENCIKDHKDGFVFDDNHVLSPEEIEDACRAGVVIK